MNGSDTKQNKAVIDTNVIFMALYDTNSKAARVINAAIMGRIKLFSTDSVKEEISLVIRKELDFSDEETARIINSLPISWIAKELYEPALIKTEVKHKADKPIEALSIVLGCGILSADMHFKNRIKVDDLLGKVL